MQYVIGFAAEENVLMLNDGNECQVHFFGRIRTFVACLKNYWQQDTLSNAEVPNQTVQMRRLIGVLAVSQMQNGVLLTWHIV